MNTRAAVLALAATAVVGVAERSEAIPAFARRYDVECHFCHEGYPKLNAMGQRFKERGFRMSKEEDFDFGRWARTVPVSVRAMGTRFLIEDAEDSSIGFFKGITAGNFGSRFSYWVDAAVLVTEGDDNFSYNGVDNAWGRLEVLTQGKLYLKGGRLELDLPFTQARTPHLFSYDIYHANSGYETDEIGVYQQGGQVGGDLSGDWRWSAAVVQGHNNDSEEEVGGDLTKFEGNVYLRLSKRADKNRFGAFAYIGRNHLSLGGPAWKNNLVRVGGDLDVWVGRLNLYGVGMYGSNDNAIATPSQPAGTNQETSFGGGFLQADLHARDNLALTLRFNVVSQPDDPTSLDNETNSSVFPGLQFWFRHLKLSFEYGFQNRDRGGIGAIQAEVAF